MKKIIDILYKQNLLPSFIQKSLYRRIAFLVILFTASLIYVLFYIVENSYTESDTLYDAHEMYSYASWVNSWGSPPDTLQIKPFLSNLNMSISIYKDEKLIYQWDYINKPVNLEFLVARVHSLLAIAEHLKQPEDNVALHKVGRLELDQRSMSVRWEKESVNLTLTEFWIVEALARHPGHVKNYDALNEVTRQGLVERNTINGYIRRIRNKFRAADPGFNQIETVHGTGYKWSQG